MFRKTMIFGASLVVAAAGWMATESALANSPAPGKRHITIAAVEPKGGVTVDQELFPATVPAGGGYVLKKPDASGRWEVSAYRWDPNQIIVNEGDDVTLEIVGINGAMHPGMIEGYNVAFEVKRGHVTMVNFKADKPGVFRITCHSHGPSMMGELIVMKR
jgi:heme/copper-type cytochrome/quinol oxidase subunit 2